MSLDYADLHSYHEKQNVAVDCDQTYTLCMQAEKEEEEEALLTGLVRAADPNAHCECEVLHGMRYFRIVLNGKPGKLTPYSIDAWREAWKIVQSTNPAIAQKRD
jgi:hypothetical protein